MQLHCGRPSTSQVWMFRMTDISHEPALGFMQVVTSRDAATLLPIIQAHIQTGTIIHSDQWAAYNGVQQLSNVHQHETFCRSYYQYPHTKGGKLLEQGEDKVKKDEEL